MQVEAVIIIIENLLNLETSKKNLDHRQCGQYKIITKLLKNYNTCMNFVSIQIWHSLEWWKTSNRYNWLHYDCL